MNNKIKNNLNIPDGYWKLDEVYTNGYTIVICGEPLGEDQISDDHPLAHNCDDMGCGSVGPHVIAIVDVSKRPPPELWPKYNVAEWLEKLKKANEK